MAEQLTEARRIHRLAFTTFVGSVLLVALLGLHQRPGPGLAQAPEPSVLTGSIEGVAYKIEVPANWNGTLLLFSHGTVRPGMPNPARDTSDAAAGSWLLNRGFALAGSATSRTGYALAEAFHDNLSLLDYFKTAVGIPKRTIAWGISQGGMISAGMAQKFPQRLDGALPICGFLAGAIAQENVHLDSAYVILTLLAPNSDLPIVNILDGDAALAQAQQIIADAQATPEGRARLALAAAVGNVPGWYDPTSPPPAADDYPAQEVAQFSWFKQTDLEYYLFYRAELEQRAGGNFSWNSGVDYRMQLERSIDRPEVYALYRAAGLSLENDLQLLASAPRIDADPGALQYLVDNVVFDGQLSIPVLTLHTMGDGRRVVGEEQAYAATVQAAGRSALLRQAYVNRGGHCTFTDAEELSAMLTLVHRLDMGQWAGEDALALNAQAAALGSDLNALTPTLPTAPAFVNAQPAPFLRPFDARCVTNRSAAANPGELGPLCY
jgi:pimeloyl-ACP methyl ester carboxylesterase